MPPPSPPSISSAARLSPTALRASLLGAPGQTISLYYRLSGATSFTPGGSVTSSGDVTLVGLVENGTYELYAVAQDVVGGGYSLPAWARVRLFDPSSLVMAAVAHVEGDASLIADLAGGVWAGQAADGSTFPYATVDHAGSLFEYTSESTYVEAARLVFELFTPGAEEAEVLTARLRAHLDGPDWPTPLSDNSHFMASFNENYSLNPESYRDSRGRLVYRSVLPFTVWYSRKSPSPQS